jgi:hypothetical protein
MGLRSELLLVVFLAILGLAGCKPEIGDSCSLSTDCSASGDRLCDTTQPGGYCTIFNCSAGTCPEEAICVAFGTAISTAPGCFDPQDSARLQRTFCMRKCDSDGDCRSSYDCINMKDPLNPWGAIVVEHGGSGKVCAVPFNGEPVPDDVPTGVCTGTDAGFDDRVIWRPGGGGAAGGSGLAGASSSAGSGAAAGGAGTAGAGG